MPGEVLDHANPKPLPSQLPEEILKFAVQLEKTKLPEDVAKSLEQYRRAALYIAAGMINHCSKHFELHFIATMVVYLEVDFF